LSVGNKQYIYNNMSIVVSRMWDGSLVFL
jgi:hypothetical protein